MSRDVQIHLHTHNFFFLDISTQKCDFLAYVLLGLKIYEDTQVLFRKCFSSEIPRSRFIHNQPLAKTVIVSTNVTISTSRDINFSSFVILLSFETIATDLCRRVAHYFRNM